MCGWTQVIGRVCVWMSAGNRKGVCVDGVQVMGRVFVWMESR